jgi:hypothetical protein
MRMLRRIRRRARRLAALEAAVGATTLGLGALALGAAVWRARGGSVSWRVAATAAGACALLGAAWGAARRISDVRCARLLDAAIDRRGKPADRVLSALSFSKIIEGQDAPLARAMLVDAVARARALSPAFVAPARRPRALPALAGATLALLVVGAWPARAPGARHDVAEPLATTPQEPRVRIAAEVLEAELAELAAAATAADAAGDASLTALAREARATLDALEDGALGRGEALDRLSALVARAREAADETEGQRAALRAAGKALDSTSATRALGRALAAADAGATEQALHELAASAATSERARADVASAMSAAASGVGSSASGDDAAAPGEGRRRLNREREAAGAGTGEAAREEPSARRLEHLRRDLDETAAACRADAATCAKRLQDGAGELPREAREARQTASRRRLENAVRQVRERLRRGELEEGTRGATERRFARVARGETRPGEGGQGNGETRGAEGREAIATEDPSAADGERGEDVFMDESSGGQESASGGQGPGQGSPAGATADAAGAARGEGAGHEPGGEPLGRGSSPPTRGHDREVRVRDGAGPNRSEVIEASARRGFAARSYVRVFDDYQPVVEESLATEAVPEGRRYVVRRYFQLIRPRATAGAPSAGGR